MAANLTPQYLKAQEAYRRATTPEEELQWLQIMFREMPKHKATDKLQADLKQKISDVKKQMEKQVAAAKKAAQPKLPRQGAGRAVIIGGPNAGKSSLLKAVTRATPEVAPFPFTTREPQPGMMPWEDVMVQLIDTPPITADVYDPNTQGLIRGADLVLLMVDLGSDTCVDDLQAVLQRIADTKTRLARDTYLDEDDVGLSYTKTLLLVNKIDLPEAADRLALLHEFCPLDFEEFAIATEHGQGMEELRNTIYQSLDVVRCYTKVPTKKEPDYDKPYTVHRGQTLSDVAELIHRDFAENLKYARVWGAAIHPGSQVKGDYVIHDKDVVELHM
ncbi:MAG TPA: GTPase [Pirellulaceae bacterium]|nr:GTPase [Pirellulaceae bacterium]